MIGDSALRVLIVDDEPLARQRIEDLLTGESGVELIASVGDAASAIHEIRTQHPDLVFLDIQMPGMSGLDVVKEIGPDEMPATIYVTAYDQYALTAFELAATDYLVKPFDDERFASAFQRARRQVGMREAARMTRRLLALMDAEDSAQGAGSTGGAGTPGRTDESRMGSDAEWSGGSAGQGRGDGVVGQRTAGGAPRYLERIAVERGGQMKIVPVEQIDYITASGPYAELHAGSTVHLIREKMATLEDRLDPAIFVRIHRSVLARVDRIEALLRGGGGDYEVRLKSGVRLPVSRGRYEVLAERLGVSR